MHRVHLRNETPIRPSFALLHGPTWPFNSTQSRASNSMTAAAVRQASPSSPSRPRRRRRGRRNSLMGSWPKVTLALLLRCGHSPHRSVDVGYMRLDQPMSIAYDTAPPPGKGTRRNASSPSLLNRIEKPPLLDRLSKTDIKSKPAPAPYVVL